MNSSQAFHRGTACLFALLTPEQTNRLATLECDADLSRRVEELAEKASEGELTSAEREEYEAYFDANNLLAVLQAESQFRVSQPEP